MDAFLAGNVEDFVDDAHNGVRAMADTLGNVCSLCIAGQRAGVADDLCVAADDVERCANLMTHVTQEVDFHAVSLLRLVACNEQVVVLTLQLAQVSVFVHAIDQQTYQQEREDDNGDGILKLCVAFADKHVARFSILQVVG